MATKSATATVEAPAVETALAVIVEDAGVVEIPKSLSTGRPTAPNPQDAFVKALADDRKNARALNLTAADEDALLLLVKSVSNNLNKAGIVHNVTVMKRTESTGKNSARLLAWAVDRQKRTRKASDAAATDTVAETPAA